MANSKNRKNASGICFTNERSGLITKVENNTGGWRFFSYLYNKSMFRVLGLQFLMLLFVVPTVFVILWQSSQLMGLTSQLPYTSTFGLGIMPWFGLDEYIASNTAAISQSMYLWLLVAIPVIGVGLCGGFAVIRDAYWTGQLRVCKSFFKGVGQTFLKFVPFLLVFALGFMGNYYLSIAISGMASWLQTVINIAVLIILAIILLVGFVYLGTITLFDMPFVDGLKNAIKFTFYQFFQHMFTFLWMLLPVLFVIFMGGSVIGTMIIILFVMFGMLWVGLVWMIHMIRSTAPLAK